MTFRLDVKCAFECDSIKSFKNFGLLPAVQNARDEAPLWGPATKETTVRVAPMKFFSA